MKRRLVVLATLAWGTSSVALRAQQAVAVQRPWRVGLLTQHDPTQGRVIVDLFLAEMRAHGFEPGRDFMLETRHGERSPEQIEARAKELALLQLHLLVGGASAATAALARATRVTPIVGIGLTLPVESGLVQSFARPGGNVTGSSFNPVETGGKLLEVLVGAAPGLSRVALVWNAGYPGMSDYRPHVQRTAELLGVTLHFVDVRRAEDFRLQEVHRTGADALYVVHDYVVGAIQHELIAYAKARRLPSIGTHRLFTQAGGLLSLNVDPRENFIAAADYAIRILNGADPATLPVQEPTRFQLVFNRRTAEAIGFTATRALMLRVNEVIA